MLYFMIMAALKTEALSRLDLEQRLGLRHSAHIYKILRKAEKRGRLVAFNLDGVEVFLNKKTAIKEGLLNETEA